MQNISQERTNQAEIRTKRPIWGWTASRVRRRPGRRELPGEVRGEFRAPCSDRTATSSLKQQQTNNRPNNLNEQYNQLTSSVSVGKKSDPVKPLKNSHQKKKNLITGWQFGCQWLRVV